MISVTQSAWGLAKDYFWSSKEANQAGWLLFGAVITTIGLFALVACFSWWTPGFWAALAAKDILEFAYQLKLFGVLSSGILVVNYLNDLCLKMLDTSWYNWLSKRIISSYTNVSDNSSNNFLELHRCQKQISNPQQRLLFDISTFVKNSISLTFSFLALYYGLHSLFMGYG